MATYRVWASETVISYTDVEAISPEDAKDKIYDGEEGDVHWEISDYQNFQIEEVVAVEDMVWKV
jgi:hypothetical protein